MEPIYVPTPDERVALARRDLAVELGEDPERFVSAPADLDVAAARAVAAVARRGTGQQSPSPLGFSVVGRRGPTRTQEGNMNKCHGHNLDHQGVAHVCTDLCTTNECCKGEALTGFAAVAACHEADRLYIAGDVAGRNALLATVAPGFRNGREILVAR